MIFLLSLGQMIFLFPKNIIFFLLTENERWSFSKNRWKYDVFSVCGKDGISFATNMKLPFCQKSKKAKIIFFRKIHLKMTFPALLKKYDIHPGKDDIGILDWHSRNGSKDSLYFIGDLFKCFHIFPFDDKNTGNLIYRIEIWLYL